jgi:hypothetical protein
MKNARRLIACALLALTAAGAFGCLTARGRGPEPRPRQEEPKPVRRPPHPPR